MNTGYMDASVDMTTEEMNIDINIQELNTETTVSEMNVNIEAQELDADMEVEEVIVNLDTSSSIEVDMSSEYGIRDNKEKDINFYDYDGTLLHSYYADQFLNSASMPPLPSRPDLICEGWNWSLENAKQQVLTCNKCDIGAIYKTIDGTTKIKINLDVDELLTPCLNIAVDGTANIDWGDGTNEDITGTISQYGSINDNISTVHNYNQTGKYTISIKPENDSVLHFYHSGSVGLIDGQGLNDNYYRRCVTNIFLGDNVYLSSYAVASLPGLETITIPKNVTIDTRNNSHFAYLGSLKHITIPNTMTRTVNGFFNETTNMKTVSLPETLIVIENLSFYHTASLKRLIAPYGLFSIGDSAFYTNVDLETIYIGNAILANSCFRGCAYFTEFTMSDTTSIPDRCFQNCSNLKLINLGNTITTISQYAFQYCSTLIKVVFPSTLTAIRSYSFAGCTSIIKYDFTNLTAIPSIYSNSFNDIPNNCEIVVPDDLYDDWIVATNWSNLAEHIVKASEV